MSLLMFQPAFDLHIGRLAECPWEISVVSQSVLYFYGNSVEQDGPWWGFLLHFALEARAAGEWNNCCGRLNGTNLSSLCVVLLYFPQPSRNRED